MIPLYDHQKKIIAENKLKCGLFMGTGAAKTRTALHLAEGSVLVICPKQQREDKTWQRENEKWETNLNIKVISKEDLRTMWEILPAYDTVIIDECHNNFGVTAETRQRRGIQIPKASQIFEATLCYLKKFPPKRLYLCSATPVGKPMNMWAIATLLGEKWDFFSFRNKYYSEIRMGQRRVWVARKDDATKERLAMLVKRFGYTGSLNDFFDVPEQVHRTVYIDLTAAQKSALKELSLTEADPLVRRSRARTIENGLLYGKKITEISEKEDLMTKNTIIFPSKKIDYILERAIEFPKLLLFVNYTAQINEIARVLRDEGYKVSTLMGSTKDRTFIKTVDETDEPHIIVAQAQMSSGYQLPSFPCVIYASKNWQHLHYNQSMGRVLRADHLKKNLYIHLVVKGGPDEDCHKTVLSGEDFQEKLTLNI